MVYGVGGMMYVPCKLGRQTDGRDRYYGWCRCR